MNQAGVPPVYHPPKQQKSKIYGASSVDLRSNSEHTNCSSSDYFSESKDGKIVGKIIQTLKVSFRRSSKKLDGHTPPSAENALRGGSSGVLSQSPTSAELQKSKHDGGLSSRKHNVDKHQHQLEHQHHHSNHIPSGVVPSPMQQVTVRRTPVPNNNSSKVYTVYGSNKPSVVDMHTYKSNQQRVYAGTIHTDLPSPLQGATTARAIPQTPTVVYARIESPNTTPNYHASTQFSKSMITHTSSVSTPSTTTPRSFRTPSPQSPQTTGDDSPPISSTNKSTTKAADATLRSFPKGMSSIKEGPPVATVSTAQVLQQPQVEDSTKNYTEVARSKRSSRRLADEKTTSPESATPTTTPSRRTGESALEAGSSFESISSVPVNKSIRFSWRMARAFVKLRTQPAESFGIRNIPFSKWKTTKIPTLGASPTSSRVQEMYKATLPGVGDNGTDLRLFIKCIPINIWKQQWEEQNKWNGEFATDGENFVMEAAALAFLHEYAPGIAPKLLGILEKSHVQKSNMRLRSLTRPDHSSVSHIIIVSELYGEDLLDYLDRRDKLKKPLTVDERKQLQFGCLILMQRLHALGLAHLDFTPENILFGSEGLRLCDFAKATPMWSPLLRHVPVDTEKTNSVNESLCTFESCEPTIGKGAYMPPECWKIYWRLETERIQKPLTELAHLLRPEERSAYYFRVSSADVYMAGVVLFWIWSDGQVWRCSDPKQDEKYYHLVKSGMNFDLFSECRSWPSAFKDFLAWALRAEPWRRATLSDLLRHPWFAGLITQESSRMDSHSPRVMQ